MEYKTNLLHLSGQCTKKNYINIVNIQLSTFFLSVVLSATVEIALRTFLPQDGFRVKWFKQLLGSGRAKTLDLLGIIVHFLIQYVPSSDLTFLVLEADN